MSRKFIALIAMLIVVSMLLPACANGGEEETTVKETEAEITETEETTEKETTTEPEEETTETEPEEAVETMVLTDLDGNEKVYQIINTVEIEGVKYVALLGASVEDDELDIEDAQIYRVETKEDEESFVLVEDKDELDLVSKEIFPDNDATEDTTVDKITDSTETTVSPESDGGGGSLDVNISVDGGSGSSSGKETDKVDAPDETVIDKETEKPDDELANEDTTVSDGNVDSEGVDSTVIVDSDKETSAEKETSKVDTDASDKKDDESSKPSNSESKEETKKPSGETKPVTDTSKAPEETKKPAVETEPSVEITTPEETVAPPVETTAPAVSETLPTVTTVQTEPVTETTYPLDTVIPLEFVTTASGKVLVHTISDRTTNKTDDNSNTLAFIPMKDPNAVADWGADHNKEKVNLATARPGLMRYGVLFGYDDYLFYKDTLNDFQGIGVLATSLYKKAVADLKARNDWVEANGMKFYFVIAPNKNTVYPDYMTEDYTIAEYRRYDQFVELLSEAGITAVDLRETMANAVKANPQENLYYKYDTHWNNHAGYHAYRTTMDLIDEDFPNVVIHDRSEYQINYAETYMKDLCWYTGNYDRVTDYGPVYTLKSGLTATLTWKDTPVKYGQYQFSNIDSQGYSDRLVYFRYTNEANKNAPNIYVMRDSYSIALVPFMKDSFYKSTYNWTWEFDKSDIMDAEADVVMVIVAERNLRNYVNNKAVVD